ncbi:hypothetical protein [Bacillus kwashiorkori]|uniref:hypothetical protein n=1 Tax=Bacillus kwashiorkori TaxID=1522318 RepID=UPI000782EF23|nr:hypothetical protein [Bacillus kwashiorkori]
MRTLEGAHFLISGLLSNQDLLRILRLLREGKVNVNTLHAFSYGSVLDHLTPNVVLDFTSEIIESDEEGISVGWRILFMYVHDDDEKFKTLLSTFRKILHLPGLLTNGKIDCYEIQVVIKKLIYFNDDREHLVTSLTSEITNSFDGRLSLDQIRDLRSYVSILLDSSWEHSWPVLSGALLSSDKTVVYNVIEILEPSMITEETWLLEKIPKEILEKWCKVHENGPEILSAIVPVMADRDEQRVNIHPLSKYLVFEHGYSDRVLSNISRRLGTFSWSGSLIPFYTEQLSIFKSFKNHKLENVRVWAHAHIEGLTKQIDLERQREEENVLGL